MSLPALRGDALQPAWFLYIGSPTPVRLWTGPRTFTMGANGPDTLGGTYLGLGIVVQMPTLKLPLNGAYAQHVFGLSGVAPKMVQLINADRDALRGSAVAVARVELASDGTPNGDPWWVWRGICDGPFFRRSGRSSPVTYTVGIKASSGAVNRKRRQLALYTPSQQALRDSSDTSCDFVPTLADGTNVTWPVP